MPTKRDSIARYISILYRSGGSYLAKRFSKYNIGSGQQTFLIYLSFNEGITQDELSSELYVDKATTARALKKLEKEGYILRKTDEEDKRANRVYLSEAGRQIMPDIYSILEQWNEILTADFTDEEKDLALMLLIRMVNNKNALCK
jgi:DNA-binding MarR family transcriptional regulator